MSLHNSIDIPLTPDCQTRLERPPVSVAPMMDWTDRHCRFFLRLISKKVLLYTEMITAHAILKGDRPQLLDFDVAEHPLALQLGGDDPRMLAESAKAAQEWGYDEVNLNVGCPSDRVQNGRFGACLMMVPERVAECVAAMRARVQIPVSVKHRIGVDALDHYDDMARFVEIVARGGCEVFIVHARKAWLKGLSPKENRDIPPLRYPEVYRLKQDFPHLRIEINGGIETLEQARTHLKQVDGVMIGRAAYHNPYLLTELNTLMTDSSPTEQPVQSLDAEPLTRADILEALKPYISAHLARGGALHNITRHVLGLYHGELGARAFKRVLSEQSCQRGAGLEVLIRAMEAVTDAAGRQRETRAAGQMNPLQ